jgi:hypothetical protein
MCLSAVTQSASLCVDAKRKCSLSWLPFHSQVHVPITCADCVTALSHDLASKMRRLPLQHP